MQLDDSEYEYQPPYYHEIYCKSYNLLDNLRRAVNLSKQVDKKNKKIDFR